ncbi:MAG: transposase [Holosporaceae bacterium]|nr:transposase [Holosporaceae bacterium]
MPDVTLVYQPPYSHDLNPIEHFWSWLKKNSLVKTKIRFTG